MAADSVKQSPSDVAVDKIYFHGKDDVYGLVSDNKLFYAVHLVSVKVYCYTRKGLLLSVYTHQGGEATYVSGMCLIIPSPVPALVVADNTKQTIIFIDITNSDDMKLIKTKSVNHNVCGVYYDGMELLVCAGSDHKIFRYSATGKYLGKIALDESIKPYHLTPSLGAVCTKQV